MKIFFIALIILSLIILGYLFALSYKLLRRTTQKETNKISKND